MLLGPYLLLNVGHLPLPEVKGGLGGLAWHWLELSIGQSKAQQGDRESIYQHDGRDVTAWQKAKEGPKAVGHEPDANGRQDLAKRDLQVQQWEEEQVRPLPMLGGTRIVPVQAAVAALGTMVTTIIASS